MFAAWDGDEVFLKEYFKEHRLLIAHHRAHEKVNEGRGFAWFHMKRILQGIDEKRGLPTKKY